MSEIFVWTNIGGPISRRQLLGAGPKGPAHLLSHLTRAQAQIQPAQTPPLHDPKTIVQSHEAMPTVIHNLPGRIADNCWTEFMRLVRGYLRLRLRRRYQGPIQFRRPDITEISRRPQPDQDQIRMLDLKGSQIDRRTQPHVRRAAKRPARPSVGLQHLLFWAAHAHVQQHSGRSLSGALGAGQDQGRPRISHTNHILPKNDQV
jgi:hypothetical protein